MLEYYKSNGVNMQNIHTSKFALSNRNDLYLIEQIHEKENSELKTSVKRKIKINNI